MISASDKIIVALDVATKKDALALVTQLRDQISFFKIGLQLYTAAGPNVVREVVATGAKVFLDLKLHDIPNTVTGAVNSAVALGAEMLTIHLSGGEAMIHAAIDAGKNRLGILGVTVLTSHTDDTLRSIGVMDAAEDHVVRLAKLGVACGIQGLVSSARETARLRAEFGNKITIVTPGIRPSWSETGDQKRVTTPRQALEAGADYIVIGRPITAHPKPSDAVKKILDELTR